MLHFKYHHNHEEWGEDLDNDKVEQVLLQYAKTILQTKDLEEQVFVTESMYQTTMENQVECNIPPMMVVNTKI